MKAEKLYLDEAGEIASQIKAGKLKGAKLAKARKKMAYLKWRARVVTGKVGKVATAKKAKPADYKQGYLPNFLSQQDQQRVEEMVVEAIFKQVGESIRRKLGLLDDEKNESAKVG